MWEGSFGRATFSEWSGINANLAIAKPSTGGSIPGDRPDFPQDRSENIPLQRKRPGAAADHTGVCTGRMLQLTRPPPFKVPHKKDIFWESQEN